MAFGIASGHTLLLLLLLFKMALVEIGLGGVDWIRLGSG
jgi:hypothetical protein